MSAYGGYIQFQNFLREDIISGTAWHETTDYGRETINLAGLPAGGISGLVPFWASSSNGDYWGFDVVTASGSYGSTSNQGREAFNNDNVGSIVTLQATISNASTRTFSISIPPSADHYDDWNF